MLGDDVPILLWSHNRILLGHGERDEEMSNFSSILLICCLTDNNMLLSISLLALLYYKWLLIVNCVITWLFKPQLCEIASDFVEGYRPRRLAIWKSKSTFRDWGMKRLSKVNANEIIGRAFPCLRWLELSVLQSSYVVFDSLGFGILSIIYSPFQYNM